MPTTPSASAKFNRTLDGLPPEVQLSLLKKHVATLLDDAPKNSTKRVLRHAYKTKQRYASMPKILYADRREEVQNLLDQIDRDQKKYGGAPEYLVSSSQHTWSEGALRRDELLEEIVDSISEWLQAIWSVTYEYNAHFSEAHASLLYCAKAILELVESPSRCKCATSNIPVKVTFRRNHSKPGQVVKRFSFTGIEGIYLILYWVWREMMVSAMGGEINISVAHYLSDIEQLLGWRSLEKVLTGGRRKYGDDDYVDFDNEDDENDDPGSDPEDSDFFDDEEYDIYLDLPKHWSPRIQNAFPRFAQLIRIRYIGLFSVKPSSELFDTITMISGPAPATSVQLFDTLEKIASSNSETMVAALGIYSDHHRLENLVKLLDTGSYLLRPQDYPAYQDAIRCLMSSTITSPFVQKVVEKELRDSAQSIRWAVLQHFSLMDKPIHKSELTEVQKMRAGSPGRKERLERWVDAVTTPRNHLNDPSATGFAAVMMGILPFPPGMGPDIDEHDPLTGWDEDLNDQDYITLRDQFRPLLAARFDGWMSIAKAIRGGSVIMTKMYAELVKTMPWIMTSDVIKELAFRLSRSPCKEHVCNALKSLCDFSEAQRKRIALYKKKQAGTGARKTNSTSASSSSTPATGFPPPLPPQSNTGQTNGPTLPFGTPLPFPFHVGPPPPESENESDDEPMPPLQPISTLNNSTSANTGTANPVGHDHDDGPPPLEPIQQSHTHPLPPNPFAGLFSTQSLDEDELPPPLEPVSDSSAEDEDEDDEMDTDEGDDEPPPLMPFLNSQQLGVTGPLPDPNEQPPPPLPVLTALPGPLANAGALGQLFSSMLGMPPPDEPAGGGLDDVD